MHRDEKNILSLYDPFIECGECLHVNINKKRAYSFYIGVMIVWLVIWASPVYEGQPGSVIAASVPVLCLAIFCIVIYFKKDPVIVIDEKGILKKKKFYSWENIEAVKYYPASDDEGNDHIKLFLKAGEPVIISFEYFLFLDQKPKVMAAYIIKYFKVV